MFPEGRTLRKERMKRPWPCLPWQGFGSSLPVQPAQSAEYLLSDLSSSPVCAEESCSPVRNAQDDVGTFAQSAHGREDGKSTREPVCLENKTAGACCRQPWMRLDLPNRDSVF